MGTILLSEIIGGTTVLSTEYPLATNIFQQKGQKVFNGWTARTCTDLRVLRCEFRSAGEWDMFLPVRLLSTADIARRWRHSDDRGPVILVREPVGSRVPNRVPAGRICLRKVWTSEEHDDGLPGLHP